MPPTCIAPGCDSGNPRKQQEGEHRHFFAVPKDIVVQEKWKRCMPVKEINFTKNSKICDLHFEDEFILRYYETVINGETVKMARGKVSLADGAYPTKFPDLDSYLAKKPKRKRKLLRTEAEMIYQPKKISTLSSCHSKLEEITDQIEASEGRPPQMPGLDDNDENANASGTSGVALGVELITPDATDGNGVVSLSDKKTPVTTRLWKARDRIYYLNRQVTRLKRRIFDLKVDNRKMKRQSKFVMDSLQGLKSLPRRQQLMFEQAILQTQQKRGGMRYAPEWITDCIQLRIRSSAVYEYLRRNQYMPLPNPGTLYNFVKQRKVEMGISLQFLETFKEKTPAPAPAIDNNSFINSSEQQTITLLSTINCTE